MRILIIHDESGMCDILKSALTLERHVVDVCTDAKDGLQRMLLDAHDLVILSWSMNISDGTNSVRLVRSKGIITPVLIIMPPLSNEKEKIEALDCGADDVVVQPVSNNELIARIRALGRRPKTWAIAQQVGWNGLVLDTAKRELRYGDSSISLTRRETELLKLFLTNVGTVLPRDVIFGHVWGAGSSVADGNLDNYIRLIRKKLKEVDCPMELVTIRYSGFCLQEERTK